MTTATTRIPRVIVEGGVIVVSVLLALAADAWWDDRQLEREVSQELESVGRELRRNQDLLAFQIEITERIVRADDAAFTLLEAEAGSSSVTIPDTLAFLVFTSGTLDPSLGALDALIASGRLAAVADSELRLRLSGLRAIFEDATELQGRVADLYYDQMLPLISSGTSLDYDAITDVADAFWGAERVLGRPLESRGTVEFPNTQRLRFLIRERRGIEGRTVVEMTWLHRELEALATMIELRHSPSVD